MYIPMHQLFLSITILVVLWHIVPCAATTPETIPLIVNDGTYQPDPSSALASFSLPSLLTFLSKRGIRCYHCQTRDDYLRVAEQVKDEPEVKDPVVFKPAPGDPDDIVTAGTVGGNARDPDNEAQHVPPKLLSRSDFVSWTIPALRSFVTTRGRSCDTCMSHDDWVTQAHLYQHLRVHATAGVEATTTTTTTTTTEVEAEPVYQARVTTGDQTIRPKSQQHDTLPSLTLDQLRTFARARGRECPTCTTHAHWLREAQFVAHKRPLATAGAGAGAPHIPHIPAQTETAAAAADTTTSSNTPQLSKKDEL